MRRSSLLVALTTVCLIAMAGSPAMALDEEYDACEAACRAAKVQCITSCGEHDDPMECDAGCEEQAQACLEQCG